MTTGAVDDIPDSVLDEGFRWAVVLGSGTVAAGEQQAFERWLLVPQHAVAWQRIQAIEQEFVVARDAAGQGMRVLEQVAADRRPRQVKRQGVAVLLSLALFAALLLLPMRHLWQAQYVTGSNQSRTVALNGGARVHLDGGTAFDLRRVAGVTRLTLHRGRILVDTSAAAPIDKPQVLAGGARFTPVGTRFVVSAHENAELAVLQGQVRIEIDGAVPALAGAGTRWRIGASGLESAEPDGLMPGAWVDGVIEADNARLEDVLAALARYRRGWLRCDPAVASLRVTGLFHLDDGDGALRALEQSLPLQVERTSHWLVNVRARVQ